MSKNSYYARLIKDLAVTFNYVPLTTVDVARYWKRSNTDVQQVARKLATLDVLKFNGKGEMVITPTYKLFFKRNPAQALAIAATL